jgi:hypothetical protein
MANTNAPFGFRQFGRAEGGAPTAGFDRLFINSSDTNLYFTGDIVNRSSANNAFITNPSSAVGIINEYGMAGVFLGCEYYSATVGRVVWSSYFPGNVGSSSPANAYVCTDDKQRYIVQGTSGAVLTSTSIGMGYTATVQNSSLGNQATGQSVMTLASSFPTGLSSNAVIRVVDLYSNYAPPGVNGTSTGAEGFQVAVVQLVGLAFQQASGLVYPTT